MIIFSLIVLILYFILYFDIHIVFNNGCYACYRKYIRDGFNGPFRKITYCYKLW